MSCQLSFSWLLLVMFLFLRHCMLHDFTLNVRCHAVLLNVAEAAWPLPWRHWEVRWPTAAGGQCFQETWEETSWTTKQWQHFWPRRSVTLVNIWYITFHWTWGKREDYQNCSVLYCVLKLYTVISTLRWAVLTVFWIGFCHTGHISLYVDSLVFMCLCLVCFCFILHSCCIIVSMVGWTWCDWSLILRTYLPLVLWHCWLGHLIRKSHPQYDL